MSEPLEFSRSATATAAGGSIPPYLSRHYWWAYVHPNAVRVFEREWLVRLILWNQYYRLCDAALDTLGSDMSGRTLQVACVYGNLTPRLAAKVQDAGGGLDVVDVLPVQLNNLRGKLPAGTARLMLRDSSALALPDASYDRVLLFFLLHEQPEDVRRRTLAEVLRVVRPGGTVVVVDYARPSWWHPAHWFWLPLLRVLEPFARDLWQRDLTAFLPTGQYEGLSRTSMFGGLYQIVKILR
jgi:ubiquinone/menaquinone biosynthesis C-methylase UbiE